MDQLALFDPPGDPGSVGLQDILDNYELVDASEPGENPYILVTEPGGSQQFAEEVFRFPELGSSSPSPWTAWTREEHNPKLRDKQGINEYYKMKRIDGIIRGSLRRYKTPVLSAHWFIEPGGDAKVDKTIADFVEDNFFSEEHLNVAWQRVLEDVLLMVEYGYMPFEKVYKLDSDGKVRLRKFAPRHPADIREFRYDRHGGPDGIVVEPSDMESDQFPQGIFIPVRQLVIFSHEAEAGDLRGTSILRSAFMHYTYKTTLYKIDAIQKERHGIGVPVIKLPPGFGKEDKAIAENLGRNLRTNERAHVTLPPMWELTFAKLEGQPVDCMKSIEHHNEMILMNVMADFKGNAKEDTLTLYYKATRYIADIVTDTINHHVIPDLVKMNFARGKLPKLRARRIGEAEDMRTMSFTLRNLVGANLIRPDDKLEEFLRRETDLPPVDEETIRLPAPKAAVGGKEPNTPSEPKAPVAGLPRQAAPNARGPQANAGRDSSGG